MLHLRRVVPRRRSPSRRLRPRSRQPTVPSRTGARRRQASPSVSLSRRLCLPRLHIRPSGKSSSRRAWHPSLRSVALCCREYPAPRSHQPPAIDSSLGRVTDALPWLRAARMERLAHSFVDFEARRAFRLTQKARVPRGYLRGATRRSGWARSEPCAGCQGGDRTGDFPARRARRDLRGRCARRPTVPVE